MLQLLPAPPRWVDDLFDSSSESRVLEHDVRMRADGAFAHVSTSIRDAVHLDAPSLRTRVSTAYRALNAAVAERDRHPVRFWNFVPDIGAPMLPRIDRYMVFNAGRHDAIADGNHHSLATASAVGVTGSDLSIHCLAMDKPGKHVENPRQIPSWQYSARYGPLPPSFSRATMITFDGRPHLLIGGTASVVGEDSRHAGDVDAQLSETLENIASVVSAATGHDIEPDAALAHLVDVRVYVTKTGYAEPVMRAISPRFPRTRTIDVVVAQICRPELLLEIEGLAAL